MRVWRDRVLCVFTCLRAHVVGVLACLRAYVLKCLRARVLSVLNLRACYDACLACSALAYSRFCIIFYFVCINQGFTIKRKLSIHGNLS